MRPSKIYRRKCASCKRVFEMPAWYFRRRTRHTKSGRLFCGRRCLAKGKVNQIYSKCIACRKSFHGEANVMKKKKYCSRRCMIYHLKAKRVSKKCMNCWEQFTRKSTPDRPMKFCSAVCFFRHQGKFKVIVPCDYCGRKTKRNKRAATRSKNRFCSIACRKRFVGERSIRTLSKKCELCGLPFQAKDKKTLKRRRFCSSRCYLRSEKHSEPEKKVYKEFLQNGVRASKSKNPLSQFTFPDLVLKDRKICIYVDGTYWHRNSQEKDGLQNRVLRAAGYKVFRIPEEATKDQKSLSKTVLRILNGGGKR